MVSNAIKFTEKGFVIIRVKNAFHSEKVALHFEIEDTGFGIPQDKLERIFEKFYRVGSEDTRKTKGTGLGLFIVKELIKAHHGTIKVTDNQPQGTVFAITLPIVTQREEELSSTMV